MIEYLVEFVGTLVFVLVILNVTNKKSKLKPYAALIIGLTLAALIQLGGAISGGNFNPAVSLAVGLTSYKLFFYILSQLLGGLTAKYIFTKL